MRAQRREQSSVTGWLSACVVFWWSLLLLVLEVQTFCYCSFRGVKKKRKESDEG